MEKYKCSRCGKEFEADSLKSDGQFSCPFCFFGVGKLVANENQLGTEKIDLRNPHPHPKECANCGADQRPGSTLCKDCIIACGGQRNDYKVEGKCLMEMFQEGRKIAEIDMTGWTLRQVARVIDIERLLLDRTIKINRV